MSANSSKNQKQTKKRFLKAMKDIQDFDPDEFVCDFYLSLPTEILQDYEKAKELCYRALRERVQLLSNEFHISIVEYMGPD